MTQFKNLFSPLKYGNLNLKNRIVMAPMSVHMTHDGSVTDQEIAFYERRARGGAGLIIIGSLLIRGDGDFGGQLYIDKDERIDGLKKLVDTIHKHGAKVSAQIHHSGRETNARTSGYQPVCASLIEPETLEYDIPRVLTTKEVGDYVEYYAQAIRRAKEAGFDAVEIHCAHGYLIAQFLSPLTNKRTDKYGGSFLGRTKFITEIFQRARELVGEDYTITVRISGDELRNDGIDMDLARKNAKYLEDLGAAAISVSAEMFPFVRTCPNMFHKPGVNVYLSDNVKQSVKVPVMTAGRINSPQLAEEILTKQKADLIGMGRILIADPDFPMKAMKGRSDEIVPCIGCNKGCHDRNSEDRYVKCTLNPEAGRELYFSIKQTEIPKKVIIVGGGPAGMEAARVATLRGHKVKLFEKEQKLGGKLLLAAVPPYKQGYMEAVKYLEREVNKLNIQVSLGCEISKEDVIREQPDVVILATGSSPIIPNIPGVEKDFVVTADDILAGKIEAGSKVVVVGGGSVGAETAHYLMETGPRNIVLVEMLPEICCDMPQDARIIFMREIKHLFNLCIMKNTIVIKIEDKAVILKNGDKEEIIKDVDTVVMAVGASPNTFLKNELEGSVPELHVIGDAIKARDVLTAVFEGSKEGRNI